MQNQKHDRKRRDGRREKENGVLSQRKGSYLRKIYFYPASKDGWQLAQTFPTDFARKGWEVKIIQRSLGPWV